jgi:hypothetical protein
MTTTSTTGINAFAELAKDADQHERLTWYAAMARWAPSKHNSQPWCFAIRDCGLELSTDSQRALRVTDPAGREMVIALGAAVHVATVAMRSLGYEPTLRVLPDGRVRLTEGPVREVREDDLSLCREIPRRRTDRGPLDASELSRTLPFVLQSAASAYGGVTLRLVTAEGDRKSLAALVGRADRLLVQQRGVDDELRPWLRDPEDPRPDGVPASHTRGAAASYRAEFVQRDFSTSTSQPAQDRAGKDAALVGVLCASGDTSTDWLATGQALSSVLLHASASGASASYLNQPIELPGLRAELQRDLLLPGVPQVVLRIGAGSSVAPTPRRDVKDMLTDG